MTDERLERELRDWMISAAPTKVPSALAERARRIPNAAPGLQRGWLKPRLLAPLAAVAAAVAVVVFAVLTTSAVQDLVRVLRPSPTAPVVATGSPVVSSQTPVSAPLVDDAGAFPGGLWARRGTAFYRSTDGGASWLASSIQANPLSVFVLDATHAWTLTIGPGSSSPGCGQGCDIETLHVVVNRTADGGLTWQSTPLSGDYGNTYPVTTFADANVGYVVMAQQRFGPPSTVLRSDDGGATWRTMSTGASLGSLVTVAPGGTLWSGAGGWAGGSGPQLLQRSTDAGATWRVVTLPGLVGAQTPGDNLLVQPRFFDALDGVVAVQIESQTVLCFRTADGGRSWQATAPLSNGAVAAAIITLDHWLAASNPAGKLAETTDGGATWNERDVTALPDSVGSLAFADDLHGVALVNVAPEIPPAALYVTSDGGQSWRPAALAPSSARSTSAIPTQPPAQKTSTWTPVTLPHVAPEGTPVGGPAGGIAAVPGGGFIDFAIAGPTRTIVLYSADGLGWTQRGEITGEDASGVTGPIGFNGKVYVALGTEQGGTNYGPQSNGAAWVSTDLVHWTKAPTQNAFGGAAFSGIAASSDGFVAIGFDQGGQCVWRSADGLRWNVIADEGAFPTGQATDPTGLVHTSRGFVIVGHVEDQPTSWTSVNGETWIRHTLPSGSSGVNVNGIADGPAGLVSFAVGPATVEVAPGDARAPVAPWLSSDGVTWRSEPPSAALFGTNPSVVAGPGGYVATGTIGLDTGARLWTSTDGVKWIPVAGANLAGIESPKVVSDGRHLLLWGDSGNGAVVLVSSGVDR